MTFPLNAWQMEYLVTETDAMTGTDDFSSCLPRDLTPLHRYCYHFQVTNLVTLTDIAQFALYNYITMYHEDDEVQLPASNLTRWRETSSIPSGNTNSALMALVQYVMRLL